MTRKGNLTREQAIDLCGLAAVDAVDAKGCDFTNRVGYNGVIQGDDEVEFSGYVSCEDKDGYEVVLTAYYYQDAGEVDGAGGELDSLEWTIAGYEIA